MISILAPSPLHVDIPHLLIILVSSNYKTSLPSYNYYNLPSIVQHILLGVIHHPLGTRDECADSLPSFHEENLFPSSTLVEAGLALILHNLAPKTNLRPHQPQLVSRFFSSLSYGTKAQEILSKPQLTVNCLPHII